MHVNLSNLLALSTTATLVEDPSWRQALTGKTCGKENGRLTSLKKVIKRSKTAESLWEGVKAAVIRVLLSP